MYGGWPNLEYVNGGGSVKNNKLPFLMPWVWELLIAAISIIGVCVVIVLLMHGIKK